MNENKNLTSDESLAIITSMINTAKGNVKRNSFFFLFWGWLVVIASLGEFYLNMFTDFAYPFIVWTIALPGWIISMIYGYKKSEKQAVKTYSDTLVMWTWLGFLFSILVVIFAGGFFNYNITALILLFSGFATFVTGLIIRYKPSIIGGSSLWIFSPIALYVGIDYAPLVMAVAIVVGYLIPGYMIKKS